MSEFKIPQDEYVQPGSETETPESENEMRDLDDIKDELEVMAVEMQAKSHFTDGELLKEQTHEYLSLSREALEVLAHESGSVGLLRLLKFVRWMRRSVVVSTAVKVTKFLLGAAFFGGIYLLVDLFLFPWIMQLMKQFGW